MRAFVFIAIVVIGAFLLNLGKDEREAEAAKAREAAESQRFALSQRIDNVSIRVITWEKSGFDNVMLATLEIKNNNDFPVKDILVECSVSAPSGTSLGSTQRTVYEAIPAKSSKTVRRFNMGLINTQASRGACGVRDVERD